MTGADNDWFWVVRSPRHNPSVVLFSGGDYLQLLNSGTNGLRDIRRLFSTASETRETIYKFDGTRYKIAKDKWTEKPQ